MNSQDKRKFLKDAVTWAIVDMGWNIEDTDFHNKLFRSVSPMSNFEIGHDDIVKYIANLKK